MICIQLYNMKTNIIYQNNYLLTSIESLNIKHIFFKFDEFGRMHRIYNIKKILDRVLLNITVKICEDIKNYNLFLVNEKLELFNPEFRYFI